MAAAMSKETLLEELEKMRAKLKEYEAADTANGHDDTTGTESTTALKRKADGELGAKAKKLKPDHSTYMVAGLEPQVVTVVVVSAKEKMEVFTVREDLLYSRAPNVRNWPNTTTIIQPGRQIRISGRGPTTFKLYLRWITSPPEDLASDARNLLQETMTEEAYDTRIPRLLLTILVSPWALADELGDRRCKNSVMDSLMVEHAEGRLPVPPIRINPLLERCGLHSQASRWLLDHCIARITVRTLDTHRESLPVNFESLVLRRILEKNEAGEALTEPTLKDACRYHDHAKGEARCT